MGRPFYPSEADDPDLDWLVTNFLSERPDFVPVDAGSLPLILMPHWEESLVELSPEQAEEKENKVAIANLK